MVFPKNHKKNFFFFFFFFETILRKMNFCTSLSNSNLSEPLIPSCSSYSIFLLYLCQFYAINFNRKEDFGGAIFLSSTNIYIIIEKCFFFECFSEKGGAIYISSSLNSSFLNNCFFNCSAKGRGQAIFHLNVDSSSLSQYIFNSFTKCSYNMGLYWGIYISKGKLDFLNINFSYSINLGWDLFRYDYINNIEQKFCTFSYCKSSIFSEYTGCINGFFYNQNIVNISYNFNSYDIFFYDYLNNINLSYHNSIFLNNLFTNFQLENRIKIYNSVLWNNIFISLNISYSPNTLSLNLFRCLYFSNNNSKKMIFQNFKINLFFIFIFVTISFCQ